MNNLVLRTFLGLVQVAIGIGVLVGIVLRLRDEERLLAAEPPGYQAYREKVRWRLLPGLY